jgi:hypothetical protein
VRIDLFALASCVGRRPELKRFVGGACKAPREPSLGELQVDGAVNAHLRKADDYSVSETAPFRRYDRRAIALGPTNRERTFITCPGNVDAAFQIRERAVFPGIGGKLIQRQADTLSSSRSEEQPRTMDQDALTDEIGEVGELGAHQIMYADPVPLILDQQVLIGCECLQALREARDVILVVRT